MASLLKWAKDRVQNVQNVAQGVEHAAATTQHAISRGVAQVNPLDQGRTYQNNAPVAAQQGSVIHQATHNGASNVVGSVAKPLVQFPVDAGNLAYNRAVSPILGTPRLAPNQTALRGISNFSGATGTARQTLGSGIQTALTIGSGGIARGIEKGAAGVVGAVAPKVATKAAVLTSKGLSSVATKGAADKAISRISAPLTGGVINAGFGASSAGGAGAGPKQIIKAGVQSGAIGLGLGAIPVAPGIAADAAKGAAKVATKRIPLNDSGFLGLGNKDNFHYSANGSVSGNADQVRSLLKNQIGGVGKDVRPTDPLAGLKQEALKHKSADEFANAQARGKTPIFTEAQQGAHGSYTGTGKDFAKGTGTINVGKHGDNTTLIHEVAHQRYEALPQEHQGALDYALKEFNDKNPGAFSTTNDPAENIALAAEDYLGNKRTYGSKFTNELNKTTNGRLLQDFFKQNADTAANGTAKIPYSKQQLTDLYNQAHTEAKGATPAISPPSKGIILKETKPRAGRQDVIVARRNPETGHLQASQESIVAPRAATLSQDGQVGSLQPQAANQRPPGFLAPEPPDQASVKSSQVKPNIELDRSVQNTLKNGTSEDAVQTVMDTTGADLQNAAHYVSRVAKQSGVDLGLQDSTKNPLLGSVSVPKVKEGDVAQPVLNAKFVQEHEHRVGQQALDSFGNLTAHDQVLLKNIETGTVGKVAEKADNPQAFKQAEQSIRSYYDTRHAYDRYLGIDVGYRTNYLRQIFNKVEQTQPNDQISLKGSTLRPGYTKTRTNETLGADVHDALQKDISGASFNHAKLTYEKGINEATGGKVAKGELVRTPQDGNYVQIQHPYGQDLSVPQDVAKQINNRVWDHQDGKVSAMYDKVNHGLKYVKLSGGFFHAFTESGNFLGQQLVSGKMFSNPAATGKFAKVFFSPKTMDGEIRRMTDQGVMDKANLAGLTTRPKEIKADINVSSLEKGTSKVAKYTGIQSIHNATFQREIPYAKLKIFEQQTEGLDPNKTADLTKMRDVARSINNVFGGINREVHGINPRWFKILQKGLLATDFTEGKWATLYSALGDKGPGGKIARQTVAGKILLFGILASALGAASGEYKGATPKQIAKNTAGNFIDPAFKAGSYTVSLPKTQVSEVAGAIKPYNKAKGAPWNASGLIHYATSRTAALPSEAIQLANNKDYYGQPLYGNNTKKNGGKPISPAGVALNLVNTVAPIPFGQGVKTAKGTQNLAASGANILGFNARPTPAPKKASGSTTSIKAQASQKGAKQPQTGIYQVKGKDGSTKYATLQGSSLKSFTNLNDAKAAQSKNEFKYSKQTTTSINGQQYHKSSTGTVVKGAPPAPKMPTTSNTTYDASSNTWTRVTPSTGKTVKIAADGTQTVTNPGIGRISNARPDYVTNITTLAKKYNVDPYAALSVAAMEGLGGGVGDGGHAFGPFQLNDAGGVITGKFKSPQEAKAWSESPAGIEYAMQEISKVAGGKKGQDAINAIVNGFERPADPNNEIAGAAAIYGGRSASLSSGSTRSVKVAKSTEQKAAATTATANKQSLSTLLSTLKSANAAIKPPKKPAQPNISVKVAGTPNSYKKTALRQYSVKKAAVSRVRRTA